MIAVWRGMMAQRDVLTQIGAMEIAQSIGSSILIDILAENISRHTRRHNVAEATLKSMWQIA